MTHLLWHISCVLSRHLLKLTPEDLITCKDVHGNWNFHSHGIPVGMRVVLGY